MPKHRASTPLETARLQDRGAFVTDCSAVIFSAMRAAKPAANDRERAVWISTAIQDSEALYAVLLRRGHRP